MRLARVIAKGVVKTFGGTTALAGVDLTLSEGERLVLRGHNGSGKSTLARIVAGLTRPTRGQVTYDGRKLGASAKRDIGYLGHTAMLYPDLTGMENLRFFADMFGLKDSDTRIGELKTRLGIGRYFERPARTWSRGQLQRVGLARALLHDPSLLLLDEPATGLDKAGVDKLVEVVRQQAERGSMILLVTHDDELASRVGGDERWLERGRLVDAP